MLQMLRAIAREPLYRAHVGRMSSRHPDDVWYDAESGWLLTFALDTPAREREDVLLFRLTVTDHAASVSSKVHVVRSGAAMVELRAD